MIDKYELFNLSDIGQKRKRNEDYFASFKKDGWLLLLLCDGMGGMNGGREASRKTVDVISRLFNNTTIEPKAFFTQAVSEANKAVLESARLDESLKGMGSTLVMTLYDGNSLHYAHVGDSRLYLLRQGKLQQLTRDHSYVNEMIDRGIIETNESRGHKFKNRITRCIGQINSRPSICNTPVSVEEGDQFLICSDGLTDMVDDHKIETILNTSENIELATKNLIDTANKNGGVDNITVQLLRITSTPQHGIRIGLPSKKDNPGSLVWKLAFLAVFIISMIIGLPKIINSPSVRPDRQTDFKWDFLAIGDSMDFTSNKMAYSYFIPRGRVLSLPIADRQDTIISAGPPSMPVFADCTLAFCTNYLSRAKFFGYARSDSSATYVYTHAKKPTTFSEPDSYRVLESVPAGGHLLRSQDTIRLYFKTAKKN